MRFFEEETGGKTPKETIVVISHKEARTIIEVLNDYVSRNKRKLGAKKLLKEMNDKWSVY